MRTVLVLLAVAVVVESTATGQPASPDSVGRDFRGDDIEALVEVMKAYAKPKDEFETTAEYEARRAPNRKTGASVVFVIDPPLRFLSPFQFDADSGTMTGSLKLIEKKFYLEKDRPQMSVAEVRTIRRSSDEFVGSNAFGARATVRSFMSDVYGIATSQKLIGEPTPTVSFKIAPATAKELKDHLRLAVRCTISSDSVLREVSGTEATLDNPIESYRTCEYIQVQITEMFVFDERNGLVFARTKLNSELHSKDLTGPANVGPHLRVWIRPTLGGYGSVGVDGGKEESLLAAKLFEARHEVRIIVKTEDYQDFNFLVNDATFRPDWSVHKRLVGGRGPEFDYAEAVITYNGPN